MFNLLILAAAAWTAVPEQSPTGPQAPGEKSNSVRAVRVAGPIALDGKLDEEAWSKAEPLTNFVQREPNEGERATERTEVRVLYDDDAIYVGARLFDSQPKAIKALLGRRDSELTSDSFTVYLDSYNDKRTGLYFGVSAGGTLSDGTLFNDDWNDNSWDGVWEGKARPDDGGWSAEFRIPLSQLRFRQGM